MKRYGLLVFFVALAILAAVLAFCFSSQPGPDSNELSEGIVRRLLELLRMETSEQSMRMGNFLVRKAAHFTIYFLLGLGLTCAFHWQKRLPAWLPAILMGVAFAASDEYHQLFTGRSAMVRDVILDACGVAAGCIAACAGAGLVRKRREMREQKNTGR